MTVTRFAPSPSGYLHLGHACSGFFASDAARRDGGRFLLRIEDIDPVRCKPEFTDAIFEDLHWLGLRWEEPVRRQSQHLVDYETAFKKLRALDVVYPCFCTRKDIADEAAASMHAPHSGPDGPVYPGTCRNLSADERTERLSKIENATTDKGNRVPLPQGERKNFVNWRLDVAKASTLTGPLLWSDRRRGRIEAHPEDFGDVVLARKDVPTSYHLSVTVDDHLQGITLMTRGEDLFRATDIHRLLQALLGYATPDYHHHPLLTDAEGRRFAKRDKAVTLRSLRAAGQSPDDIRTMCGGFSGAR